MVQEGMGGVQMAVNRAHAEMDTGMPSMVEVMPKPWPTPPTYFKLNAFTIAFQVPMPLVLLCFQGLLLRPEVPPIAVKSSTPTLVPSSHVHAGC